MNLSIIDALNAPDKAIVALINYSDRKVYLTYTHNVLSWLMRTIMQLKTNSHPCQYLNENKEKLVFQLCEGFDQYKGNLYGRYKLRHWSDYIGPGMFEPVNNIKHTEYTPKLGVHTSVPGSPYGWVVRVCLISTKRHKVFIKEFDTVYEAEDFISKTSVEEMLKQSLKL